MPIVREELLRLLHSEPFQNTYPAKESPAVPVLYTNNPVAGEGMVVVSVVEVKEIQGAKTPLFVDFISSIADASGEVVPIPTPPFWLKE